jgi:hypothetical protein
LSAGRSGSLPLALLKVEAAEFIGHPLYPNCIAPSEFRPPPEGSTCRRVLTSKFGDAVEFWHRKTSKSPSRFATLISAVYSHPIWAGSRICSGDFTAVVLRNFRKRMAQRIIPNFLLVNLRFCRCSPAAISALMVLVTDSIFVTLIGFDRHDTALAVSKLRGQVPLLCRTSENNRS